MCGGKADRERLGVVPGKRCGVHVVMGEYMEKLLVNCGGGVLQVLRAYTSRQRNEHRLDGVKENIYIFFVFLISLTLNPKVVIFVSQLILRILIQPWWLRG